MKPKARRLTTALGLFVGSALVSCDGNAPAPPPPPPRPKAQTFRQSDRVIDWEYPLRLTAGRNPAR